MLGAEFGRKAPWLIALAAPVLFIINALFTHRTITNSQANISDWHLDYRFGFIRRGFRGELLSWWQFLTQLEWAWAESTLRAFPMLILCSLIAFKLIRIRATIWSLLATIFPLGFLYFLYDPGSSGTPEIWFLILAFSFFHVSTSMLSSPLSKSLAITGLFILAIFVSLIHEGMVFFVPLIILIALTLPSRSRTMHLLASSAMTIPFASHATAILIFEQKVEVEFFCLLALERLGHGSCAPLNFYNNLSLIDAVRLNLSVPNAPLFGFFLAWLVFGCIYIYVLFFGSQLLIRAQLLFRLLFPIISIGSTFPIYLVGSDWARWFAITCAGFYIAHLFAERFNPLQKWRLSLIAGPILPVISGTLEKLVGLPFWLSFVAKLLSGA